MQAYGRMQKRGFTLVELLTVVAIIALLVGLLVPAIGKVRDHAKKASTQNLLEVLGKGCEMFQKDFERYPRSTGANPFEASSTNVVLAGAQWLVLELAGADLKGYVAMDKYRYPDTAPPGSPDGAVDEKDWQHWYGLNSPDNLRRWGPYVELEGKSVQTPENYAKDAGLTLPDRLTPGHALAGSSDFNNGKLPMAVDAFDYPVLYYLANDHAKAPFTYWSGSTPTIGCYTQSDNAAFTGSTAVTPTVPGFDLGAGADAAGGQAHWLAQAGWPVSSDLTLRPAENGFAGKFYDRGLFDQQGGAGATNGKVWPHRDKTFVLISPGKDGIYGTSDDVTNF